MTTQGLRLDAALAILEALQRAGYFLHDRDGEALSRETFIAAVSIACDDVLAHEPMTLTGCEPRGCPTPGACSCPDETQTRGQLTLAVHRLAATFEDTNMLTREDRAQSRRQVELMEKMQAGQREAYDAAEIFRAEQREHMKSCERAYQRRLESQGDVALTEPLKH